MKFAKIFLQDSSFDNTGLGNDAKIYKMYLPYSEIYYINDKNLQKSKVNIFLEVVPKNFYHLSTTADINVLMVNQEFLIFNNTKLLRKIDIVFAKNRYAVEVLQSYRKYFKLKFKIYYTKFTSIVDNLNLNKKSNTIAHFAGKSRFKMTDLIYTLWAKNPNYPKITISCFKSCYDNLKKYSDIKKLSNVKLYKEKIPSKTYNKIVSDTECFVCPSYMEGYGHYINEGRGNAAFIITTDGPPMNELIDNTCGILIDAKPKNIEIKGFKYARSFFISEKSLKVAIEKYLSLSKNEIDNMRTKSYNRFVSDTIFFRDKMKDFYEKIVTLKEKELIFE